MILSDEKLFCTEQSYDAKNNVVNWTIFNNMLENLWTVKCFQNKDFAMIWAAISHNGKIDSKIHGWKTLKNNAGYYQSEILVGHF